MFLFGRSKKEKDFVAQFNELVRPELVEAMKSPNFKPPLNQLTEQNISFLLVAVAGSTPNGIGGNLGIVADTAKKSGWWADYLFSNLAVLANGIVQQNNPPPLPRAELVSAICASLGGNCKSIGGEQFVPWGDYGSENRRVYGPLLPNFLEIVSQLNQLSFGEHGNHGAR